MIIKFGISPIHLPARLAAIGPTDKAPAERLPNCSLRPAQFVEAHLVVKVLLNDLMPPRKEKKAVDVQGIFRVHGS
ncbi:MAG: hypothetical protein NZ949_08460 [Candidatus Kapabacteria bacterium]|nr:hypothetical protein [Candidatus Kapabacteria bacterium]